MQTAKDFPTFLKRTDGRSYDIVVTAPHFAVRASDSGKYVVRATLVKDVQQLFVVRKDSPVKTIQQLAGKAIATPPKSALMTMMGKRYLKDAGLTGNKQPAYRSFTSHNAANQAVLGKEMDAAIASSNIIKKAIQRGEQLRILEGGNKLPNMALLVASDLDGQLGEQVQEILVGMKKSEKGKQVLKQVSFPGYRAVTARDYEPARPYMEQAAANMKKAAAKD
jgi:phosphonate transport system substrate-binding protein